MGRAKTVSEGPRRLLLGAVVFLTLGGLVMIFSAAFVTDYIEFGDTAHTLKRQLAYVAFGAIVMAALARMDYRRVWRHAWMFVVLTDIALVAVLAVGVERGGSQRWIEIGPVSFQPSEFAKVACVLALAAVMSDKRGRAESLRLVRVVAILPPALILIMFQPDMGTAMSLLIASFLVLWLGGLSWGHTFTLAGAAAAFTAVGILAAPYRVTRWLSFRDPWADPLGSGYQTIQGILAFASGGLIGVGLGMSRQKYSYLPEAHTDFILAIIGEEVGLIGTLAVVIAFMVLAVAGFRIALASKDPFGRLLAGGLTSMLISQAVINMFAVTNLMPVTGIPLPFVSYGGNSIVVAMASIGLMVSVSRYGTLGAVEGTRRSGKGAKRARTAERRRDGGTHLSRTVRRGRAGRRGG